MSYTYKKASLKIRTFVVEKGYLFLKRERDGIEGEETKENVCILPFSIEEKGKYIYI